MSRCFRRQIRNLHEKWRGTRPPGASGTNVRTPEIILHVPSAPSPPKAKWHLCVGTFVGDSPHPFPAVAVPFHELRTFGRDGCDSARWRALG
eukprot:13593724-Alexandrium_andersonii.AAC.1